MSRKVIVLKFGSSVLQSRADLPHAVHEIYRWIRRQYRVVAVVSAFAGETDRLLATVEEYQRRQSGGDRSHRRHRRRNRLSAFLTLELDRFGIPAQVLDPSQIQLIADTSSNDTEPVSADLSVDRRRVEPGQSGRDSRASLLATAADGLPCLAAAAPICRPCFWLNNSTHDAG